MVGRACGVPSIPCPPTRIVKGFSLGGKVSGPFQRYFSEAQPLTPCSLEISSANSQTTQCPGRAPSLDATFAFPESQLCNPGKALDLSELVATALSPRDPSAWTHVLCALPGTLGCVKHSEISPAKAH